MATDIAMAVWPLYFVLALGYLAGKHSNFTPDAGRELMKLAMSFALPAMLFVSTASLSRTTLTSEIPSLGVIALSYVSMFLLSVLIVHYIFKRSLPEAAIAGICAASPAGPLFGPAILPELFGAGGMIAVTIAALVLNLVQSPIAFALIGDSNEQGQKRPASEHAKNVGRLSKICAVVWRVVSEPVVFAPFCGMFFVLGGIPLPRVLAAGFRLIGSASAGIAIFATGLMLEASRFRLSKEVAFEAGIKMIAVPSLVVGLAFLCGIHGALLSECIVVSALSSGLLGMMIASREGIYVEQAASATMLTSVSLVIFLPIWILISKKIGGYRALSGTETDLRVPDEHRLRQSARQGLFCRNAPSSVTSRLSAVTFLRAVFEGQRRCPTLSARERRVL